MANNEANDTTTINVKGVRKPAWEAARKAGAKQGEAMGSWLSRACETLANLEAGPREFPPDTPANLGAKSGNPSGLTEDQLTARMLAAAALMQGLAAIRTATGKATGKDMVMSAVKSALEPHTVTAGRLQRKVIAGLASGKDRTIERQPETNGLTHPHPLEA